MFIISISTHMVLLMCVLIDMTKFFILNFNNYILFGLNNEQVLLYTYVIPETIRKGGFVCIFATLTHTNLKTFNSLTLINHNIIIIIR